MRARCGGRNETSTDKITTENIFLGVGSDEAIDIIIRVACTPRVDSVLITPPTYGMYSVCAHIHDVDIVSVPLHIEAPAENPKGLKVCMHASKIRTLHACSDELTATLLDLIQENLPLPSFHIDPLEVSAS